MRLQPATSSVLPCPFCANPMSCRLRAPDALPAQTVELTFACEDCGTELTGVRRQVKIATAA